MLQIDGRAEQADPSRNFEHFHHLIAEMVDDLDGDAAGRDQANVQAYPYRPEILVTGLIQLVKAHARIRRVHLLVEDRGLDRLLLVAGQAGKAAGEGFGDAEIYLYPMSHFH